MVIDSSFSVTAPRPSVPRTVKVNVPAVPGTPLISPELPAKSNSFVPRGRRPSTTLNEGCLFDDAQPVTVMKNVNSVPTWPVTGHPGDRSCMRGFSSLVRGSGGEQFGRQRANAG